MPELPEVEIARRQLDGWFTGKRVSVDVLDEAAVRSKLSSRPSDAEPGGAERLQRVMGTAEQPVRHGKRIGWPFGEHAVLVHLGMTGRFVQGERPASARLGFGSVWFVDRRRFGCVTIVPREEMWPALRAKHGPDALDEALDGPALQGVFTGRRAIKVALMDQSKLAGLGNIHAAEALWRAGIDPRQRCQDVTRWDALAVAIVTQLQETIVAEEQGTLVYVTDGGPNRFAVYGREGETCPTCGAVIEQLVQGGRSTFFCGSCQKP